MYLKSLLKDHREKTFLPFLYLVLLVISYLSKNLNHKKLYPNLPPIIVLKQSKNKVIKSLFL